MGWFDSFRKNILSKNNRGKPDIPENQGCLGIWNEMRYLYEMHKKRQLASENNNISDLSTMLWFHHIMASLTFGPFLEMKGNNGREKSSTCKTIQKSRMKNCVFVHLKFSNIRDHDMNTYILNLPKQWLQIPKTTLPSQAVS